MSIELTKTVSDLRAYSPQKKTADTVNRDNITFDQILGETVKPLKIEENSKLQAVEIVRFSQLQLLHGLFSDDEATAEDSFFSAIRQLKSLPKTVSQQGHIIDKHYAVEQPSLLNPEQKGRTEIERMIDQVATKVSLAPELIHSVVAAESSYNPAATSHAGAQGLMQLMPETAKELGVQDSYDPLQNLLGGSKYLKQLLDKYDGDLDSALAAYNWGQGNVDRQGLAKMPTETRDYLAKVKSQIGIQST